MFERAEAVIHPIETAVSDLYSEVTAHLKEKLTTLANKDAGSIDRVAAGGELFLTRQRLLLLPLG